MTPISISSTNFPGELSTHLFLSSAAAASHLNFSSSTKFPESPNSIIVSQSIPLKYSFVPINDFTTLASMINPHTIARQNAINSKRLVFFRLITVNTFSESRN